MFPWASLQTSVLFHQQCGKTVYVGKGICGAGCEESTHVLPIAPTQRLFCTWGLLGQSVHGQRGTRNLCKRVLSSGLMRVCSVRMGGQRYAHHQRIGVPEGHDIDEVKAELDFFGLPFDFEKVFLSLPCLLFCFCVIQETF